MNTLVHPTWPNRRAPAFGWGISLLAHALAAAWLLHARQAGERPHDPADTVPAGRIEVRLVPLRRPATRPLDAPMAPPSAQGAAARPRRPAANTAADLDRDTAAPARAHAPAATIAADTPASPVAVSPAAVSPAAVSPVVNPAAAPAEAQATPAAGDAARHVDLAAARSAARQFGRDGGKSLVALPERKLVVDPNADRRIVDPLEAARRPDCQSVRGQSANLLANVVMLAVDLAKNAADDSGCKW